MSGPKRACGRPVMAAAHARVQRHHEPVLARHPRHLQQHVAAERGGLVHRRLARQRRAVDARRVAGVERVGAHVLVAVVGRDRAVRDEVPPPHLERAHVAGVVAGVDVRDLAQPRHGLGPAGLRRLEIAVRAERRDHAARPARVGGERVVGREVVARDRRWWPAPRSGSARRARAGGRRPRRGARRAGRRSRPPCPRDGRSATSKISAELRLQPEAHRRAAEDGPVLAQPPPDRARGVLGERPWPTPSASSGTPDGVQQPRHVVIGRDEQRRGVRERLVVEQQARIDVAVRRDDRQLAHRLVEPPGDRARLRVGGQQPVRVQREHGVLVDGHARTTSAPLAPTEVDMTSQMRRHRRRQRIGSAGPTRSSPRSEIRAFVHEQLAAVDLDGRSVCVLVRTAPAASRCRCCWPRSTPRCTGASRRLTVLVALGTHAAMSEQALAAHLGYGRRIAERYPDACSTTPGGTRRRSRTSARSAPSGSPSCRTACCAHTAHVRINRAVVEHDVTLIVGPVFPHEVVGFSGGNKYLFPGVSGRELIDLSHWLGALITSARDHRHARDHPGPRADRRGRLAGPRRAALLLASSRSRAPGTCTRSPSASPEAAWAAAADVSAETHIRYLDAPVRRVLSLIPAKYDDMWTGAKGFYKVEPIVADGGEVVLYAPHISRDQQHPSADRRDRLPLPRLLRQAVGPLQGLPLGRPRALDAPARRRHLRRGPGRARSGGGDARDRHPRGADALDQPRLPRPGDRSTRRPGRRTPTRWSCPTPARTSTGCADGDAPRPPQRRPDGCRGRA